MRFLSYLLVMVSVFGLLAGGAFPVAAQSGSGSITTLFSTVDLGQDGNMFDVMALTDLRITSFDLNFHSVSTSQTCTVEVYYKTGTYVGFENNAGAWTLLGSATVTANSQGTPTALPVGGLTIPAGQTYSLYITDNVANAFISSGDCVLAYTNGSNTYANADIQLDLGVGKTYPFGTTFDPRTWNGTIYYDLLTAGTASDDYQKIGQVVVNAPGTALYEAPGGGVVRDAAGQEIWIPNQTAFDPSQDTYDVIEQTEVDGSTWVQIFVGNTLGPVWIPVGGPVSSVQ